MTGFITYLVQDHKKTSMMKNLAIILALLAILGTAGCSGEIRIEKELPLVPYPKDISVFNKGFTLDPARTGISASLGTEPLTELIHNDIYRLTGVKPSADTRPVIFLSIDRNLAPQEYEVIIRDRRINITGGDYQAVVMGWSTVLQAASIAKGKLTFDNMEVRDKPDLQYRGLMLDLARVFHTDHVVKQIIDICRWYKIAYMHLHLNDDWRNVFPTKTLPRTLTEGEYYTEAQLQSIIDYAAASGVVLIPEVEGPGHSSIMRVAYPEIFGKLSLYAINLADDKALEAMKAFSKEVMDMFPDSPYFHIGGDEVNLGPLEQLPQAKRRIRERGYDNVHDLYLEYLVEMHEFVKSHGKQTLVWEGFNRDGSAKVKIPKDIIVCAFETMYQRPDSLARNGYTIMNTAWTPLYIVPNRRWSTEKIYNWNYYTWENCFAPPSHNPIVLDENDRKSIMGTQMCSWEMGEEMEYPALCKRLAVMSERSWNTEYVDGYDKFEVRMDSCEARLRRMIYPFEIAASGVVYPDYKGVHYNFENHFAAPLTLSFRTLLANTELRYTADGSFPGPEAPVVPETLVLDTTTFLKFAQYDSGGGLISYRPLLYENRPLRVDVGKGEKAQQGTMPNEFYFRDSVAVRMSTPLEGAVIRYRLDGKKADAESPEYTGEFYVDRKLRMYVQCFDREGNPVGEAYDFWMNKR